MSEPRSESTVLNGPGGEVTMAFKDPQQSQEVNKVPQVGQPPPPPPTNQQQEVYQRPPLVRIDSRSTLLRPGYPANPTGQPFRPPNQQIRPGPPQFGPRGPPNLNQRPSQPPFGQNPAIRNPGVRQVGPFPPRPPLQQVPRSPGTFQQRPYQGQIRPPFNGDQRAQTLDSTDSGAFKNGEEQKAALAAMKNRSYSVTDGQPRMEDVRRYSVSSTGSVDENRPPIVQRKSESELLPRPGSKAEQHMDRITESEVSKPNLPDDKDSLQQEQIGKRDNEEEGKQDKVADAKPMNREGERMASPLPPKKEVAQVKPEEIPMELKETKTKAKLEDSPKRKVDEINKNIKSKSENNDKEEIGDVKKSSKPEEKKKSENISTTKMENAKPPKGRNTPDLKIPLRKKSTPKQEGDNDSGVDESTQGNDQSVNGEHSSPRKSGRSTNRTSSTTPTKSRSSSRSLKSPNLKSPDSQTSDTSATEKKKVPMNKIQVGSAPSPNLKVVKSKIGSLENTRYKPGGGNVKIENRKLDFAKAQPKIAAKNEAYAPSGGNKKIQQQKLNWNAKSKIGSLENAHHKPQGGDKKIESQKLDFKDKAKPKVGSKDNMKHVPGGGDVKSEDGHEENKEDIENRKIEIKVQSKVGSLDNVKHRPGGGDKKIFDDKEYLRQKSALSTEDNSISGSQKKKRVTYEFTSPNVTLASPSTKKVKIFETVQEIHQVVLTVTRPVSANRRVCTARSVEKQISPRAPWRY